MFKFKSSKKVDKREFSIPEIGTLHYTTWPNESFWMGVIDSIAPNKIDLSIKTFDGIEPTQQQVDFIKKISIDIEYYMDILYSYLEQAYRVFSQNDIRGMFFLAAIELQANGNELLFTLEANFNVPNQYDSFKYFTVINKIIKCATV